MTPHPPGSGPKKNKITVMATSAEGDTADIEINIHQKLAHLLTEGLKALYGRPGPDPAEYDLVIAGSVANLDSTVDDADLADGAEVAILPKDVSRG